MKFSFRHLVAAAGLAASLSLAASAAEAETGYVDIGELVPAAHGEFVEVNLSPGLLKFASRIASKQDPDAAAIIANLKRVRVNVVTLDDGNRDGTVGQFEGIRRKLESQGWTPLISVREREGDNVAIHAKQKNDDVIEGLVVTVLSKRSEAVFVNVVGTISADQIATIAEQLDIEPLRHVRIKSNKGKAAAGDEV